MELQRCDRAYHRIARVLLSELAAAVGPLGLPVEQDLHFTATQTLSAYTALAREHRRIVT